MLNNVNLCGRLTADPELKNTSNGVSVTAFTIAVDRDYTNGNQRETDFINIVAWRNTAEFITKYFSKGKQIILNGSLQVRKYTDKNGNNRSVTEVIADRAYFAGDKQENATRGNYWNAGDINIANNASDLSDLPF